MPSYVITGATGGVGSAVTSNLAASGANLFLAARNQLKLEEMASRFSAESFVLDVTEPGAIGRCIEVAAEHLGSVDGVAHCVGSLLLKPAHVTSDNDWQQTLSVNLTSAFEIVRAATKKMTVTGGSVVLVSSAAARTGFANHEAIAAAKAGVIGLTLSAAASYARRGIRVNCVAPGLVATQMTERITANEAALKKSLSMHPLGRIGKPEDVASAIAWLLDPDQSWVTGQILGVDGGLGTVRAA